MIDNLSDGIDLDDYAVSWDEFYQWVSENNIDVYAVASHGGNRTKIYCFKYSEDFTAFKLKFSERQLSDTVVGYKGRTTTDTAMYYCPYLPLLENEKN